MNNQQILTGAVIILLVLFAYREISTKWKTLTAARNAAFEKEQAERRALLDSMTALSKNMQEAAQAGIDSTKLLGGTMKACETVAAATVGLRDIVAAFTKIVGAPAEKGYPENNYLPGAEDDSAAVDRTATFIDALRRNVPVEQALQEASEAEEKKTMLSSISFGPEI